MSLTAALCTAWVAILLLVLILAQQHHIKYYVYVHPEMDPLWLAAGFFCKLVTQIGFIPLFTMLLTPFDCTRVSDGGYILDADPAVRCPPSPSPTSSPESKSESEPELRCYEGAAHIAQCIVSAVALVVLIAASLRLMLVYGELHHLGTLTLALRQTLTLTLTPTVALPFALALDIILPLRHRPWAPPLGLVGGPLRRAGAKAQHVPATTLHKRTGEWHGCLLRGAVVAGTPRNPSPHPHPNRMGGGRHTSWVSKRSCQG
jgi:hypothetical protein